MLKFVVVGNFLLLFFSFLPAPAQIPEKKEQQQSEVIPNFNTESPDPSDLVRRYYQRQFSRQNQLSSRPGSDLTGMLNSAQMASALEGPVDPAEYIVGPSDILAITIGGVAPFSHAGPVTPEGLLVIPTVGEVVVAGEVLAEVKKNVSAAVRKKYTTGDIGVHLVSLRTFRVSVVGAVAAPGAYIVSPVDRVDYVVKLATLEADLQTQATEKETSTASKFAGKSPPPLSLRNIKLYRTNKDTLDIDLVRFYSTGETRCNPFLRDGDIIFVPAENLLGNSVSILGAVRAPGVFEFHDGDSLSTLLRLALGPTALADLERIEIVRFLSSGRQAQTLTVNWRAGQNGHVRDMALQRNDRIFIRDDPEIRKERRVNVYGAVAKPGEYAILHERTKLSEIIARAGGFNPDAAIAEAQLIRRYEHPDARFQNPDYVRLRERRLIDLKPVDSEYFDYESSLKRGFVAVDFARLFNQHDSTADVEVLQNDEIFVPITRQSINVFGQVTNPGYVVYLGGMDYHYYIEKAGGYSRKADRNKVRILKRNTDAWLKPAETDLEPGDQIFVSRLARRPPSEYWNAIREVIQTTASIATVVLLYRQVK
jgi:protein involved in polysaccharide export with SLBB domain